MVTDYLMNALLITMFVIIGIIALYAIFRIIRWFFKQRLMHIREREYMERRTNERFEFFASEMNDTRMHYYKLDERISKLEEKKKNVKKK